MVAPSNHGAPVPQFGNTAFVKCIWPRKDMGPLTCVSLSPTFWGFWTHFASRTILHVDEPAVCQGCKDRLPLRWQGYLPCWCRDVHGARILVLSEGAARQLLPIRQEKGTLRGAILQFKRRHGAPNAPVDVTFQGMRGEVGLPEDFDPFPHLARLWNHATSALPTGRDGRHRLDRDPNDPSALDRDDGMAGALVPA